MKQLGWRGCVLVMITLLTACSPAPAAPSAASDPIGKPAALTPVATEASATVPPPSCAEVGGGDQPGEQRIDAAMRTAVIDDLVRKLHSLYVFPDVATHMETALRRHLANGTYDGVKTAPALCAILTQHLQEVSHDKHLQLFYSDELPPPWRRSPAYDGALENFGFQRVERLAGNIGYIDLRGFHPLPVARDTASAAMTLVAHTDVLIIDLRKNGGGDPAMVAFVTSYLFGPEPVHLNDLYWRPDDRTEQFWTSREVPGKRYGSKPVYVLTSHHTFSGAEEFAYNLKHLKRGTIIGEVTGGGAHPGNVFDLQQGLAVFIPTGRAINPITGTNWEGTGVIPDVQVEQESAMKTAQIAALKHVLADDDARGARRAVVEEARATLAEMQR